MCHNRVHSLLETTKRESPKFFAENTVRHDVVDKVDFCRRNSSDDVISHQRSVVGVRLIQRRRSDLLVFQTLSLTSRCLRRTLLEELLQWQSPAAISSWRRSVRRATRRPTSFWRLVSQLVLGCFQQVPHLRDYRHLQHLHIVYNKHSATLTQRRNVFRVTVT